MEYLDALRTTWNKRDFILMDRVAVVGHSRGGEYARALALEMNEPAEPWQVQAVVGLASREDGDVVTGAVANAVMLLHGAHDGDQYPAVGFRVYDNSGTEGSLFLNGVERSMKLLEGGRHDGFVETAGGLVTEMGLVTRGYLLAFLAAHLKEDYTWYDQYIRGADVPHGWSGVVANQYSDGVAVNVIDNAEDGNVSPNTMAALVNTQNVTATNADLTGSATSFHETRVLRVTGTAADAHITWRIPEAHRDASIYEYLSFRIGQAGGTPDSDLAIMIRNGDGEDDWSSPVAVTEHGRVAQAMEMCVAPTGDWACLAANLDDRVHMETVRIPLSAFGAVDDVQRVRLLLGDATLRPYYVDGLAFSEWVLAP
jgi:hypothetical protein